MNSSWVSVRKQRSFISPVFIEVQYRSVIVLSQQQIQHPKAKASRALNEIQSAVPINITNAVAGSDVTVI